MPKPLKRALAVVSLLLAAMLVPGVHTVAGPLLYVPGGFIANVVLGEQPDGRTIGQVLAAFVIMVGVNVFVYYMVFRTIERFSARPADTDDAEAP